VENTSLLSYVPKKKPKESPPDMNQSFPTSLPTLVTNPRVQQNKIGKFLKEDISLNDDDPRDLKDPNMNMMTTLLPLDSYEKYEN
jgi:hypothetical protein